MQHLVHLLNEIGMLARTPRSGYAFLGTGDQSVAEHSHRMALVAYALANESKRPVDLSKLLLMCLLHDLPEARTGDLNYVNKRYMKADEAKVIAELRQKHAIGANIAAYLDEYIEGKSEEALLAHDADKLEMLLVLKELSDIGNPRALEWFEDVSHKLQTEAAKTLAQSIRKTASDGWWKAK